MKSTYIDETLGFTSLVLAHISNSLQANSSMMQSKMTLRKRKRRQTERKEASTLGLGPPRREHSNRSNDNALSSLLLTTDDTKVVFGWKMFYPFIQTTIIFQLHICFPLFLFILTLISMNDDTYLITMIVCDDVTGSWNN